MQRIAGFVSAAISNYHIDSSTIQRVQACLNIKMKMDGWISLILSTRECVLLKSNNGEFMNQGFVVNDNRGKQIVVLVGNLQIGGTYEGRMHLDHLVIASDI